MSVLEILVPFFQIFKYFKEENGSFYRKSISCIKEKLAVLPLLQISIKFLKRLFQIFFRF